MHAKFSIPFSPKKSVVACLCFLLLLFIPVSPVNAKTVEYDLFIEFKTVNFTGKEMEAMTINGGIPGPTLYMSEGDDVKVRVHNRMNVETSIHWHGLLVPNKEDGVPYLTTPPIKPGAVREFSFPIIQSGTYWYHSHTGLQEQRGVYGSIVIHPKKDRLQVDRDYILVLSDWTDEDPSEVLRTLKRGSDYYALKKGSMQSLAGAIKANALKETFQRSLTLTGDMERYIWSFDDKILKETDKIPIRRGENLRIIFVNKTMMHHPLHLHGHFFRVMSGQGDYAPLKHTVDIPPLGTQEIEFQANEDKDWFLHCHILYHLKAGMARVFQYEGSEVDPEVAEARRLPTNTLNKDPWFFWGETSLLTQMNQGMLSLSNTRNIFTTVWEHGWDEEYDVEIAYDRYFNRFLRAFAGANITEEDTRGLLGIRYLLPLNLESMLRVDTEGELRFGLDKEIQITSRLSLFGDVEYDTEDQWEWVVGSEWVLNKYFSIVGQYHSEFKGGVGLRIRF